MDSLHSDRVFSEVKKLTDAEKYKKIKEQLLVIADLGKEVRQLKRRIQVLEIDAEIVMDVRSALNRERLLLD